jgi:hypothetical protein
MRLDSVSPYQKWPLALGWHVPLPVKRPGLRAVTERRFTEAPLHGRRPASKCMTRSNDTAPGARRTLQHTVRNLRVL